MLDSDDFGFKRGLFHKRSLILMQPRLQGISRGKIRAHAPALKQDSYLATQF